METKLAAMINNYNNCCYRLYNIKGLGEELDKSLLDIEKFYYSDFWINRFKRIESDPIRIDIILGTISELVDNTKFKFTDEDETINGSSNKGLYISLNTNMADSKINDEHINNVIMHELGHRMYNEPILKDLVIYNDLIIGNLPDGYFTESNELRLRIIPIIKEMYDNNWSLEDTYFKSPNLIQDPIYQILSKEYIIYLLLNIV